MTTPEPLGSAPGSQQPAYPAPYQSAVAYAGPPAPPPSAAKGLAIAALIAGIVAFCIGWVPFLGIVAGLAAVVLGIIALVKRQSKPLSIIGLVLGAIALVTSIIFSASLAAFVASQPPTVEPAAIESSEPVEEPSVEPEPVITPTEEPQQVDPVPQKPASSAFKEISARNFALLAKDPDAHTGENYLIYGIVTQLDAATGKCIMRVDTAASKKSKSWDYEQNSLAMSGDGESNCPLFDEVVQDDHVKLAVTVLGSFSYDTQIGGSTTVPLFQVWNIAQLKKTQY